VTPSRRLAPFLTLLALIGFGAEPSVAAEVRTPPEQASKFVDDLGNSIATLFAGDNPGGMGRHHEKFSTLVRQGFDLEVIGRFALGRSWRSATPAQRQEYQKLFAAWTINDYERLLGANMDGRLTIIGSQPIGGQDALVHTRIDRLNGTPVEMDLRVRGTDGQMKIVDVIIGGASLGVTRRDEFGSMIQRQGLDGFISDLRSRINEFQAEATQD
jgi:phospholipid transport system substrate-binding protein